MLAIHRHALSTRHIILLLGRFCVALFAVKNVQFVGSFSVASNRTFFLGSIWYWCADQVIVQRTLAAKNISHAKVGYLSLSFSYFLYFSLSTGIVARIRL